VPSVPTAVAERPLLNPDLTGGDFEFASIEHAVSGDVADRLISGATAVDLVIHRDCGI